MSEIVPMKTVPQERYETRWYCDHVREDKFADDSRMVSCEDPLSHALILMHLIPDYPPINQTVASEAFAEEWSAGGRVYVVLNRWSSSPRMAMVVGDAERSLLDPSMRILLANGLLAEQALILIFDQLMQASEEWDEVLATFLELSPAEQAVRETQVRARVEEYLAQLKKLKG